MPEVLWMLSEGSLKIPKVLWRFPEGSLKGDGKSEGEPKWAKAREMEIPLIYDDVVQSDSIFESDGIFGGCDSICLEWRHFAFPSI